MGTVPAPYVPVAGDDATQARVLTWSDAANYLLGNATAGGSKKGLAAVRQSVAQSIPNATTTAILMDTEMVDNDNGHSTTVNTSRYTVATAGWYLVSGVVAFASNATSFRLAAIALNGVAIANTRTCVVAVTGAETCLPIAARLVPCAVGDFIEIVAFQNSGAALNTAISSDVGSSMCIEWRSN